jgi:D-arabinose 1-dehydrogenase-like Zn-dependent alcohol dehydrogenase
MKAIQLVKVGEPLQEREIPIPEIKPREVLVRVRAAGICHSDAHYRAGVSTAYPLPLTLGHEVAGVVEAVGQEVENYIPGQRVCLHYMVTCGDCEYCARGTEQFCHHGKMIGKHRDGGYAEFIAIPARSVFPLPDEIPFPQGAILMCSSATSLHALVKARLKPGESVAIFGMGGLGFSAVQLARALGALQVIAVDINPSKLEMVEAFGAVPVNALQRDPVHQIKQLTNGRGVDVALELVGSPITGRQALLSLAIEGRAALAGLTQESFPVFPYSELIGKETELIGVSDHLALEIPLLLELSRLGKIDLTSIVTRTIPLEVNDINKALDNLESFGEDIRTVIVQ